MTLKCKNLLFFPLGDLKLTINHLCACLLIRQGTLRIGVITEKTSKEVILPHLRLMKQECPHVISSIRDNTHTKKGSFPTLPGRLRTFQQIYITVTPCWLHSPGGKLLSHSNSSTTASSTKKEEANIHELNSETHNL